MWFERLDGEAHQASDQDKPDGADLVDEEQDAQCGCTDNNRDNRPFLPLPQVEDNGGYLCDDAYDNAGKEALDPDVVLEAGEEDGDDDDDGHGRDADAQCGKDGPQDTALRVADKCGHVDSDRAGRDLADAQHVVVLLFLDPVVLVDKIALHHEDHGEPASDGKRPNDKEDPEQQKLFSDWRVTGCVGDELLLFHSFLRSHERGRTPPPPDFYVVWISPRNYAFSRAMQQTSRMSSGEQPRERSLAGLARPCETGPIA